MSRDLKDSMSTIINANRNGIVLEVKSEEGKIYTLKLKATDLVRLARSWIQVKSFLDDLENGGAPHASDKRASGGR